MTTVPGLDKYVSLIEHFVVGELIATEFESQYLYSFKNENQIFPQDVFELLNDLFSDIDSFVADPKLRDPGDLDEKQLKKSAEKTLLELRSLQQTGTS